MPLLKIYLNEQNNFLLKQTSILTSPGESNTRRLPLVFSSTPYIKHTSIKPFGNLRTADDPSLPSMTSIEIFDHVIPCEWHYIEMSVSEFSPNEVLVANGFQCCNCVHPFCSTNLVPCSFMSSDSCSIPWYIYNYFT